MRRQVRETALQVLFQKDLLGVPLRDIQSRTTLPEKWSVDDRSFFLRLISGVDNRLECIDRILTTHTEGWALDRMAGVDRNILRMAVYEIFFLPENSLKVAINEAVVLGKKYGAGESGKFINGVLGRLARALIKEGQAAPLNTIGDTHVDH